MKKKVLAMVMAVAMTVGMLAGCGSKAEDTATDAPAAETTNHRSGSVHERVR